MRPSHVRTTRPRTRRVGGVAATAAVALVLVACSDDARDPEAPGDITTPPGETTVIVTEGPVSTGGTGDLGTMPDSGGTSNSEVTPNTIHQDG